MEGKITKSGGIKIKRGNKFKNQYCPLANEEASLAICGDWCPLFGEPSKVGNKLFLQLCHNGFFFEEFEDLRETIVKTNPE